MKIKEEDSLSKSVVVEFELSDYIPDGRELPPVTALWKKNIDNIPKRYNVSKKLESIHLRTLQVMSCKSLN